MTTTETRAGGDERPERRRPLSDPAAVRVHSPYKRGLPNLSVYLKDLWGRRQFAIEMARTQIRSQNLNTALGQVWMVLNPLLLALVYFMVVMIIRGGRESPYGDFLVHLVACLFIFYYFNGCVSAGAGSIVGGGRLILNTAFPKSLLPLSSVLVAMFRFLPTIPVLLLLELARGEGLSLSMLWSVPVFVLITLYGVGAAMLFATLNLYFRDIQNFLPYLLRLWLYMSPVLYFPEMIPDRYEPLALAGNPLFAPVATWGRVMEQDMAPQPLYLLVSTIWAVAFLIVGAWVFLSREREFAVRL